MTIREQLATLLSSQKGRTVALVSGAITGGITQLVTSKGLQMPGELATALSGLVAALTAWLMDTIGARLLNTSVAQMQTALPGVKVTGGAVPDGKTVNAVQALVDQSGMDSSIPPGPLSLDETRQMRDRLIEISKTRPEVLPILRQGLAEVIDRKPA